MTSQHATNVSLGRNRNKSSIPSFRRVTWTDRKSRCEKSLAELWNTGDFFRRQHGAPSLFSQCFATEFAGCGISITHQLAAWANTPEFQTIWLVSTGEGVLALRSALWDSRHLFAKPGLELPTERVTRRRRVPSGCDANDAQCYVSIVSSPSCHSLTGEQEPRSGCRRRKPPQPGPERAALSVLTGFHVFAELRCAVCLREKSAGSLFISFADKSASGTTGCARFSAATAVELWRLGWAELATRGPPPSPWPLRLLHLPKVTFAPGHLTECRSFRLRTIFVSLYC